MLVEAKANDWSTELAGKEFDKHNTHCIQLPLEKMLLTFNLFARDSNLNQTHTTGYIFKLIFD